MAVEVDYRLFFGEIAVQFAGIFVLEEKICVDEFFH